MTPAPRSSEQPGNRRKGTNSSPLPPGSKDGWPPPLPPVWPMAPGKQVFTWNRANPRPGAGEGRRGAATATGDPSPAASLPSAGPPLGVGSAGHWAASRAPTGEALTPARPACARLPGPGPQPLALASTGHAAAVTGHTAAVPSAAQWPPWAPCPRQAAPPALRGLQAEMLGPAQLP